MVNNLQKALKNKRPNKTESEILDYVEKNEDSFKMSMSLVKANLSRDICNKLYGWGHPSDYYDDNNLDAIKALLSLSRGFDSDSSDFSDYREKVELMEDVRDKFKTGYLSTVCDENFKIPSHYFSFLHNMFKQKRPHSKVSLNQFANTILNSPLFSKYYSVEDTSHLDYNG